jgi:tetratricopeptide (TPR) repeat protein
MNEMPAAGRSAHSFVRFTGIGLLIVFLLLIWLSARAGFASLLYTYAATSNQLAAANAAVSLSSGDPEAHYLWGAVLEAAGDLTAAIAEYNEAILRRPDDYVLWLSLARAQELNGQVVPATAAARQAIQLAPYYAQTHWQLGNLLVRTGHAEEGFGELRLAAASNPRLLSPIIDLAWQLSRGNVQFVIQAVQPATPADYQSLAEYFKKRGREADAISLLRSAGNIAADYRRQYLDELLTAKRFADAYAIWSIGHTPANRSDAGGPILSNPGFEEERPLNEPGFDWHTENNAQTLTLSLDPENPKEGKSSLRVEFSGDSDPRTQVISQLVLVEPNSRYQLKFAARTENIVSGGLPGVVVVDAGNKEILGQTNAFPRTISDWQDYSIDFNAKGTTTAILISLQRGQCSESTCPIFGRLWLDNFSLKKL